MPPKSISTECGAQPTAKGGIGQKDATELFASLKLVQKSTPTTKATSEVSKESIGFIFRKFDLIQKFIRKREGIIKLFQ